MPETPEPPPPIGKTWNRLYATVIAWLAVVIAILYVFTERFR